MPASITVEEAQARLKDVISSLAPGEEVVITDNHNPVARLVGEATILQPGMRPPPGLGKGLITIVSDDDAHLKYFDEYMP
jgi:antitoxin (DNA-binding transcriptional repressor) of toxin-antitoxin stability system